MAKRYATPEAFRAALEDRLKQRAGGSGKAMNAGRVKIVMERLLARLFASEQTGWLLKGGYAMELRFRPHARTTRDLDFSLPRQDVDSPRRSPPSLDDVRDLLQRAADLDLGDFLSFQIAAPIIELEGAPDGGGRFPVVATIAGKTYSTFGVDVGIGDALIGAAEELVGDRLLDFAGVQPARVRAIPRVQQFAEKIHAYTFPWTDRTNTRTKDLVDLLLLIGAGFPDLTALREAMTLTFKRRGTHPLPPSLVEPPANWQEQFALLAAETNLATTDVMAGFKTLNAFWTEHALGTPPSGSV